MEQVLFGARIAAWRKELGLTQEALAERLGVTNQAVSKWELDQCCPDIALLPALAELFGVSIDELFGRQAPEATPPETAVLVPPQPETIISGLPWPDNDDLYVVCYHGHRLKLWMQAEKVNNGFRGLFSNSQPAAAELYYTGPVQNIYSAFNLTCVDSPITGSVSAGGDVTCGQVGGPVAADGSVSCGDVSGGVNASDGVNCGNVGGDVNAGDGVNCGDVGGSVEAGDSIRCGTIQGNANAGDSIFCSGSIGGAPSAGDGIHYRP